MAQSAFIQKVSTRHEAIINYILANPTASYGDVAAVFGVTRSWLSTIVHSHAFQDQLKIRQNELFDASVVAPISDKLAAACDTTLEAYLEKVPSLSPDQLINGADKLLGRLGFGGQKNGASNGGGVTVNIQNNHVPAEVIKEARDQIGRFEMGETNRPAALPNKTADERSEAERMDIRAAGEPEAARPIQSDGGAE